MLIKVECNSVNTQRREGGGQAGCDILSGELW